MLVYFGPEVLVPLASAAAAVGGFFLLTWRKILGLFRRITGGAPPEAELTDPQAAGPGTGATEAKTQDSAV